MKYVVIKEYADAPDNPIKVTRGELLDFVEESNPDGDWTNWIYCRGSNKQGWVPKQILELKGNQVTVLQDYFAKEHNLKCDEVLTAEYELNGWIWGRKESNAELGWAPLNHLAKLED